MSKRTKVGLLVIDAIGKTIRWIWRHFGNYIGKLPKGDVRNLLILEQWGIGDFIMASYCLPALREHFCDATITLLCPQAAAGLLEGCPYVDNVVTYKFPWTRPDHKYNFLEYEWKSFISVISKMRKMKFDMAVTGFPDARVNMLLWLFGAKSRIGFGSRGGGFFLTSELGKKAENKHHLARWNAVLCELGSLQGLCKHGLWLSATELQEADRIMAKSGISRLNTIIGIHFGASNAERQWPINRFGQVADHLSRLPGVNAVVFSSPDQANTTFPSRSALLLPRVKVRILAALLSRLDLLICNDSGPMHIAGAVGTPVVALYGRSDPAEFRLPGKQHTVVEAAEMSCRPCYVDCIYSKPRCWPTITVSEVIRAAEDQIRKIESNRDCKDRSSSGHNASFASPTYRKNNRLM